MSIVSVERTIVAAQNWRPRRGFSTRTQGTESSSVGSRERPQATRAYKTGRGEGVVETRASSECSR
jgi:hypothetical protein